MSSSVDFLDDENWHGGYYELAVDLGALSDPGSDLRLCLALEAVWESEHLNGPYLNRWASIDAQRRVDLASVDVSEPSPLYGVARLSDGRRLVCATHAVREVDVVGQEAHDWLDLCLPLGALSRIDDRVGGYPFGDTDKSLLWRNAIDGFLLGVAKRVAAAVEFRVALIGFEMSGSSEADSFSGEPPRERGATYVVPRGCDVEVFLATE